MIKDFLNNDQLATLNEIRYLLTELLSTKETLDWNSLKSACKNYSMNFTYSFENTINYLHHIEVISINADQSVIKIAKDDASNGEGNLAIYLLEKTLSYLKERNIITKIINESIIKSKAPKTCIIYVDEVPYPFIKTFFLHLGIAFINKEKKDELMVSPDYVHFFINDTGNTKVDVPTESKRVSFYISYADRDVEYKEELKTHLSGLIRSNTVEVWDKQDILPGQVSADEKKKKLEEADIAIFLLSADFMSVDYIQDVDMKIAMERYRQQKLKIVPIIVRPCVLRDHELFHHEVLPKDSLAISEWESRESAYVNIVTQIRKML